MSVCSSAIVRHLVLFVLVYTMSHRKLTCMFLCMGRTSWTGAFRDLSVYVCHCTVKYGMTHCCHLICGYEVLWLCSLVRICNLKDNVRNYTWKGKKG